jgi:hypothetical protein
MGLGSHAPKSFRARSKSVAGGGDDLLHSCNNPFATTQCWNQSLPSASRHSEAASFQCCCGSLKNSKGILRKLRIRWVRVFETLVIRLGGGE